MVSKSTFEERFHDLFRRSYQAAYRVLGYRGPAEDAALETLARAWASWDRVEAYAERWVVTVAGNLAIDEVRRRKYQGRLAASSAPTEDDTAGLRLDLQHQLASLPRRQREVAVMRYLADLTEKDVAAALGCSEGTVKRHSRRALLALRRTETP